jgi:hypothetical protein
MAEAPVTMWTSEWWISVVGVGIALNLAAYYLAPYIDRVGSKVSRVWTTRNEKRAQERAARIDALRHHDELRQDARFAELRCYMMVIMYLLFSVVVLVIGAFPSKPEAARPTLIAAIMANLFMALFAFFCLFRLVYYYFRATRIRQELWEAQSTKGNDAPPEPP